MFKKYVDQEFDQTQTQTQRLHEAQKKLLGEHVVQIDARIKYDLLKAS